MDSNLDHTRHCLDIFDPAVLGQGLVPGRVQAWTGVKILLNIRGSLPYLIFTEDFTPPEYCERFVQSTATWSTCVFWGCKGGNTPTLVTQGE